MLMQSRPRAETSRFPTFLVFIVILLCYYACFASQLIKLGVGISSSFAVTTASMSGRRHQMPFEIRARARLDPTRSRVVLRELRVGTPDDAPLAVEHEHGRARGPLIDRDDDGHQPRKSDRRRRRPSRMIGTTCFLPT